MVRTEMRDLPRLPRLSICLLLWHGVQLKFSVSHLSLPKIFCTQLLSICRDKQAGCLHSSLSEALTCMAMRSTFAPKTFTAKPLPCIIIAKKTVKLDGVKSLTRLSISGLKPGSSELRSDLLVICAIRV
ncbi:hypothetical protein DFH06DRAFT_1204685 [Mycena polygramma]|nr:hypothetical protein DFH06DRAFT_1204685 [Mycena polygramma]